MAFCNGLMNRLSQSGDYIWVLEKALIHKSNFKEIKNKTKNYSHHPNKRIFTLIRMYERRALSETHGGIY